MHERTEGRGRRVALEDGVGQGWPYRTEGRGRRVALEDGVGQGWP
jgi:hypothetical protein